MKFIEKDNEIILRDTQFTGWIFGIISTLIYGFAGVLFFSDAVKFPILYFSLQDSWYWILFKIFWFLFFSAGIFYALYKSSLLFLTPLITVRIKPNFQTIDVIHRRLYFLKNHQRFYFSQVKNFALVQRQEDKSILYFLVLNLVNDEEIDLESSGNITDNNFFITVKLNDMLKKYHPENKGKTQRLKRRKTKRKMKEPEK